MNAQVTTIKIKYGEKEIELTQEEAKALKDALNSLFAKEKSCGDQFYELYKKQREQADKTPLSPWQIPCPPRYWWGINPPLQPTLTPVVDPTPRITC